MLTLNGKRKGGLDPHRGRTNGDRRRAQSHRSPPPTKLGGRWRIKNVFQIFCKNVLENCETTVKPFRDLNEDASVKIAALNLGTVRAPNLA